MNGLTAGRRAIRIQTVRIIRREPGAGGSRLKRRSGGVSALLLWKKVGASDTKLAPTWCA